MIYGDLLLQRKDMVRRRIEAGQNEKILKEEYRGVFRLLESWETLLRVSKENVWESLREAFSKERETLERSVEETSGVLENAFDFMEAAFGESQEMVFFITQLSSDEHAMWFIGENECPRYYRYNKALLFEDRSAQICRELDEIRGEMIGETV